MATRGSLMAIDVLLDPDAATVEKARAVNARLRGSHPVGFALDANHAPHVTILQRFVRVADVDRVAKAVTEVLRTGLSMRWESRAIGYYDLAYENLGRVGIVIEPAEDLRRLQQRIVDAVAPFAAEKGTGDAFAPRLSRTAGEVPGTQPKIAAREEWEVLRPVGSPSGSAPPGDRLP